MKKKIVSAALAVILALGCCGVAVAADKSVKTADKWIEDGSINKSGASIVTEGVDDVELEKFGGRDVTSMQAMLAHLAAQYSNYNLAGGFNVAGDGDIDPIQVAVSSGYIEAGKSYLLCHMNLNTGEWDISSAKVVSIKEGRADFMVSKSGPYALLVAKGNAKTNAAQPLVNNGKPADTKKQLSAPKTGEI